MHTIDLKKHTCVGIITSAHGIKGQVKIKTFTQECDNITKYGNLYTKSGQEIEITSIRILTNNSIVATLKNIITRNQAEELRDTKLFVLKEHLPTLDEDHFYYDDLIGLDVFKTPRSEGDEPIGSVLQLYNFGAGDIIELQLVVGGRKTIGTIAFTQDAVPHVNVAQGFIEVSPAYLLNANDKNKEG